MTIREMRRDQAIGYAYGYADAINRMRGSNNAGISRAQEFAEFAVNERPNVSLQDAYQEWLATLEN